MSRRPVIRTTHRIRLAVPLLAGVALLGAACGSVAQPSGWSQPVIENNTLYVSLDRGKLSAHRLGDQRERLWQFPDGDAKTPVVVEGGRSLAEPKSKKLKLEGLYGDPVVSDGTIYLTAYSGHVVALATDGAPRWAAELPGRLIGGVLVDQGTVYAGTTTGDLYALDQSSGAVRWRARAGNEIWATPIRSGDDIVLPSMNGRVYAFSRDGALRWEREVAGGGLPAKALLDRGRLYLGSLDKHIYAIDSRTGDPIWQSPGADNWFWTELLLEGDALYGGSLGGNVYAIDTATGAFRWTATVDEMVRSRPVLVNNVLVVGSKDGRLHGLRPADGSQVWEVAGATAADNPASPRGTLYADLLAAGAGIYVTTEDGRKSDQIYFLDVDQRRVSELSLR